MFELELSFTWVVILCLLALLVKGLHLLGRASPPVLEYADTDFNRQILAKCPMLSLPYYPPMLWGKSGHVQTIVYGKMGRMRVPQLKEDRHMLHLKDGATMTYDVFEANQEHCMKKDLTLLVCPGIANSSEALYIRTFVMYAQKRGYRVAVLNHTGAMQDVPLTTPKMFTYGDTTDFHEMVLDIKRLYPSSNLIAVGFSMGANIIMKFLGEHPNNEKHFLCAVSCCQGYDAAESLPFLTSWFHFRRLYIYVMTRHLKQLLLAHAEALFGPQAQQAYGTQFDVKALAGATMLNQIDEVYTRRRDGFESLLDYYRWCSCRYYMKNITLPMMLLNALDDPIVPEDLLYIPRDFTYARDNVVFVQTRHGGHLGFFEGDMLLPRSLTWLDKVVVQYCDAAVQTILGEKGGAKLAQKARHRHMAQQQDDELQLTTWVIPEKYKKKTASASSSCASAKDESVTSEVATSHDDKSDLSTRGAGLKRRVKQTVGRVEEDDRPVVCPTTELIVVSARQPSDEAMEEEPDDAAPDAGTDNSEDVLLKLANDITHKVTEDARKALFDMDLMGRELEQPHTAAGGSTSSASYLMEGLDFGPNDRRGRLPQDHALDELSTKARSSSNHEKLAWGYNDDYNKVSSEELDTEQDLTVQFQADKEFSSKKVGKEFQDSVRKSLDERPIMKETSTQLGLRLETHPEVAAETSRLLDEFCYICPPYDWPVSKEGEGTESVHQADATIQTSEEDFLHTAQDACAQSSDESFVAYFTRSKDSVKEFKTSVSCVEESDEERSTSSTDESEETEIDGEDSGEKLTGQVVLAFRADEELDVPRKVSSDLLPGYCDGMDASSSTDLGPDTGVDTDGYEGFHVKSQLSDDDLSILSQPSDAVGDSSSEDLHREPGIHAMETQLSLEDLVDTEADTEASSTKQVLYTDEQNLPLTGHDEMVIPLTCGEADDVSYEKLISDLTEKTSTDTQANFRRIDRKKATQNNADGKDSSIGSEEMTEDETDKGGCEYLAQQYETGEVIEHAKPCQPAVHGKFSFEAEKCGLTELDLMPVYGEGLTVVASELSDVRKSKLVGVESMHRASASSIKTCALLHEDHTQDEDSCDEGDTCNLITRQVSFSGGQAHENGILVLNDVTERSQAQFSPMPECHVTTTQQNDFSETMGENITSARIEKYLKDQQTAEWKISIPVVDFPPDASEVNENMKVISNQEALETMATNTKLVLREGDCGDKQQQDCGRDKSQEIEHAADSAEVKRREDAVRVVAQSRSDNEIKADASEESIARLSHESLQDYAGTYNKDGPYSGEQDYIEEKNQGIAHSIDSAEFGRHKDTGRIIKHTPSDNEIKTDASGESIARLSYESLQDYDGIVNKGLTEERKWISEEEQNLGAAGQESIEKKAATSQEKILCEGYSMEAESPRQAEAKVPRRGDADLPYMTNAEAQVVIADETRELMEGRVSSEVKETCVMGIDAINTSGDQQISRVLLNNADWGENSSDA